MCNKENEEKTRLTLEAYGNVYHFETDHYDCDMDEILSALYGLLTAATWNPLTVLESMKGFADERLEIFENYKNKEEENEIN